MENLNLKCTGMQFNVFFNPVTNIRERAIELEGEFKNIIPAGFTILPEIGSMVPLEVPRILGSDSEGRYRLSLSPVVANIEQIKIDKDISLKEAVLGFQSRCFDLYSIVTKLTPEILFCGITIGLEFSPDSDAVELLKNNFVKLNTTKDLYDFGVKYTFVEDGKYYVNLSISNLRDQVLNSTAISLQLDINDRYRFNTYNSSDLKNENDKHSESDVLQTLISICEDIIDNKIGDLLKNGVY